MKYTPGYILQAYADHAYALEDAYDIDFNEITIDGNNEATFHFIMPGTLEIINHEIIFDTVAP